MIENIKYYITENNIPYRNLALEEYFLQNVAKNQCILYLWQNKRTVVIGKNQNAYKECRAEALKEDEGFLVRRLSGGGGVFHDLGNLNFTFLTFENDYDVSKNLKVIIDALHNLGIEAVKTGRNDIEADGKKISGNAFYKRKNRCFHHGTILINANVLDMGKYLNVSSDKLKAKGVSSVKARVGNLVDIKTDIRVEDVKRELIKSFGKVFCLTPQRMAECEINHREVDIITEKFANEKFIFGEKMKADFSIKDRFSWGGIEVSFKITGKKITDAVIHTDALDWDFAEVLKEAFMNKEFFKKDILLALEDIKDKINIEIYEDLYKLIEGQEI